ncbi:MAG: hypothetical protein K2O61_01940 [Bacteroidaceae bacterium]|nr:hypothetical protein [Bacteroidaceae bacterium]
MKKSLLTLLALAMAVGMQAQTWQWGEATWNIPDGKVYEDINDLNGDGIVLSFSNPANFVLGFFDALGLDYNIYVDDATEPIEASASTRQGTDIVLDYDYVEGHSYRIVTTSATLVRANIATRITDTLSINKEDFYTISFSINGPEVVKTIDVEGTMALTIVDQNYFPTFSLIDTPSICEALGIASIDEAELYGLNPNGSLNAYFFDSRFDFWHDADGGLTVYGGGAGGGVYDVLGHNPYPAVYCIKLNETVDSIHYYFYDWWSDYTPDEPTELPSTGFAKHRAPTTSYNSVVWDWEWTDDDGNPQVTKYTRRYRVDEGQDYKAGFAIKANKKEVLINATLHFVSQEAFAQYLETSVEAVEVAPVAADGIYGLNGERRQTLQKGLNIVRKNGEVKKVLVR